MQSFLTSWEIGGKGKNIVGLLGQGNIGEQAALCLFSGRLLLPIAPVSLQTSSTSCWGWGVVQLLDGWNFGIFLCHRHWSCPRSTVQPSNPAWVGVCPYPCIINVCYFTASCIRSLGSLLKSLLLGYFLSFKLMFTTRFPCKEKYEESIQVLSKVTKQEGWGRIKRKKKKEREKEKKK